MSPRALRAGGAGAAACAWLVLSVSVPGVAVATVTGDIATLDAVLRLLAAHRHSHTTFTEVHRLAMLERPLESSGELLYEAPDHLEKRTLEPKAETLILDHGVLTAHRGHRTWTMPLNEYPQVVPFVESMRATLAGDRAALERFFTLAFDGSVDQWVLNLIPVDPAVVRSVRKIRFAGSHDAIGTVEITEADGDTSVLTVGPQIDP
ncbi:MAG: outer membrane lipoprotein carrier protein LolA [Gammaproteobacteria bacterium]|nr:outer membrane lipoprotein carrier protein LolA [Gammaproteobacteria bacterium]